MTPCGVKKDNKNGIKMKKLERLKLVKTQTHLILKNFSGGKSPLNTYMFYKFKNYMCLFFSVERQLFF